MFSGIFWGVLLIVGEGELMTIEDPSLSGYGYQLLPLATNYLVDNNREFDVSDIFWGALFLVGGGELIAIKDPSLNVQLLPIVALATSYIVGNKR